MAGLIDDDLDVSLACFDQGRRWNASLTIRVAPSSELRVKRPVGRPVLNSTLKKVQGEDEQRTTGVFKGGHRGNTPYQRTKSHKH